MNRDLIKNVITERSSNKGAVLDLDNNRGVVVNIKDVFGDGKLDVRFEANKVFSGYYCVCRLQEQKTISLTIDKLGFDEESVKLLKENIQKPSGLTIYTGKIRTGKNTTMSAVANEIVLKSVMPSICAFDDPIEILGKYPQVDYRGDIDALKSYIRLSKKQDLDFCLINEIPNAEVAFGVRDLVNSSIHTMTTWHMNRLWHLPHKLFEYFGEAYRDMLSQMNLVCNQRLYKRQCPHCLEEIHRQEYLSDERIYKFFVENELLSARVSQGCDFCDGTGYVPGGIVVLPEILKFDQQLVLDLFESGRPFEMEKVIMKRVKGTQFSLEYQMRQAVEDGRLDPNEILTIV
jgi:type II secretory ATPase GspE/PulE/Tfp pilus assembly ATPase PilB-like protein